jgi:polar amino acid transport system substrate-binding protein
MVTAPRGASSEEAAVRTKIRWLAVAAVIAVAACTGMQPSATSETRNALAPTGKLRVAFISPAFVYSIKDQSTGELKGMGPDLAKDLAERLGTPYEIVTYSSPPAMVAAGTEGRWDVALMGVSAERAAVIDFSSPFAEAESGFLVLAASSIATISDVDRTGVRIGVFAKSSADNELSKIIRNATLVRVPSISEVYTMLDSGRADVLAAAKTGLYAEASKNPRLRVLDGRFLVEPISMGVAKGRDPKAITFVDRYVADAKVNGRIQTAIDGAALRGVLVPK